MSGNPSLYGLTIHNHPDAISPNREMHVIFYWASDDNIRKEYELVMYRGCVGGFAQAYDIRKESCDENQWLPKVPRIHSIEYDNGDVYDRWNHEFQNPTQVIEIFYKLYTR